jgi:cytoskeletal protein CcmA (bactofilin family)
LKIRQLIIAVAVPVLLAAGGLQAVEFVQTDRFELGKTQNLQTETWIYADAITLYGQVGSDFFALAGTVELNGEFDRDVWILSDTVSASGAFRDSVRLAGRLTQVSGEFTGSLTAVGNTVKIEPQAVFQQNLVCLGDQVICEGTVGGDLKITAKKVTLGGQIDGDVSITAQDIVILPRTVLNGNLSYTAPKELVLSSSIVLNGDLKRRFKAPPSKPFFKPDLVGHVGFAAAALLTGLAFFSVFPVYTARAAGLLQTTRATCALTGFAGLALIPMIAFLLLLTFIGLPLSMLLILFYLILLYLSKVIVGLWLGALILRRKQLSRSNVFSTLAAGLLVIYAAGAIVALSLAVHLLVVLFGLGALLLALFKKPVLVIQAPDAVKQTMED